VLYQDVKRAIRRLTALHLFAEDGTANCCHLDQLQGVGRHAGYAADDAGLVPAASGALQQPGDALRTANLKDAIDRRKVDTQTQTRGGDDTAQAAIAQAILNEVARIRSERAMVQRNLAGPVGAGIENGLKPGFSLIARVVKMRVERAPSTASMTCGSIFSPMCPAHGKRSTCSGMRESTTTSLGITPLHEMTGQRAPVLVDAEERRQGFVQVTQRRGKAPGAKVGLPPAQASETQLCLHAALVAEQLVPLVDDDSLQVAKEVPGLSLGQQDGETLGCRHQCCRWALKLALFLVTARIAGALLNHPRQVERG
jgi:hypothetical protein